MPPQLAEGERDAHGGRQPTRENTFRVLGTHHSFEDAEALINTLLTVDTFILGFALTFLGLFSYDDLLRMDLRFATIWKDGYDPSIVNAGSLGQRETLGKHVFLPSATVAFRGYYSVGFLAISLSTSLGLYVSMALSTLREDTEFFELWFSYAKYGIIVSFTGLFVGLFYFFGMVATVVIGMYPKCTMLARLHDPAPPRHRARALTTRPHYTADCEVFKGGYESYWAPVDAVYKAPPGRARRRPMSGRRLARPAGCAAPWRRPTAASTCRVPRYGFALAWRGLYIGAPPCGGTPYGP